jgi:hypothetical protein
MNKTCPRCKQTLDSSLFFKNHKRKNNLGDHCKECSKVFNKSYVSSQRYKDNNRPRWHSYKRNAKKRELCFNLEFKFFNESLNKSCFYCGKTPARGMDRVDSNKGYSIENCVPCCKQCNYGKRSETSKSFIEHCNRVVEYQKLRNGNDQT